ncbi:ABC transporter ATP-binding protein [Candidatus Poribacteria bacterium]|nr:ABC transporter ATP-binding protein [Candidatus Poribacteria bacterium]
MSLIKVNHLSKSYKSGRSLFWALSDVSLSIEDGEFLALMGPSGAGKSTLLTALGGLNHPTEGDVKVDDISIYQLPGERLADFRAEYIGFVFQSFQLIQYLSVLENVTLPLAISGKKNSEQRELAEKVLKRLGLSDKLNRLPGQLSGGEQGRVAIARAIINNPPIILADEPTGNLDSKTGKEVMELFVKLNAEGQTIVIVTHSHEYARYIQRLVEIRDGKIQ